MKYLLFALRLRRLVATAWREALETERRRMWQGKMAHVMTFDAALSASIVAQLADVETEDPYFVKVIRLCEDALLFYDPLDGSPVYRRGDNVHDYIANLKRRRHGGVRGRGTFYD